MKAKSSAMIKRFSQYIVFLTLLLLLGDCAFLQNATVEISAEQQPQNANARPWFHPVTSLRQMYVTPSGTGDGSSLSSPMNLEKAINTAKPGDLYWLQEGPYRGGFVLKKNGTEKNPIIFRGTPGKRVVVEGGFHVSSKHTWIWGLEITDPTGISTIRSSVEMFAPGTHVINNVIHDGKGKVGIGAWTTGEGQVIYGNIVYKQISKQNNPHNLYIQNDFNRMGYKYVVNNMFLDASDVTNLTYNVHAYTQGGLITGLWFEKNVVRNGRFLIGGFNLPADHEVVKENYFYEAPVQFGYRRPTQVRFQYNYLGRSQLITRFFWGAGETQYKQTAPNIYSNNEIYSPPATHVEFSTSAFLGPERCDGCAKIRPVDIFDENKYSSPFHARFYADNKNLGRLGLSAWRNATAAAGKRFDGNSTLVKPPRNVKVVILKNDYEPTRAHLVVYNWSNAARVRIDLGSFLPPGSKFTIFDAKKVFQAPILSGTYTGPIELPLGQELGAFLIIRS
jgi:hypothetical protein